MPVRTTPIVHLFWSASFRSLENTDPFSLEHRSVPELTKGFD